MAQQALAIGIDGICSVITLVPAQAAGAAPPSQGVRDRLRIDPQDPWDPSITYDVKRTPKPPLQIDQRDPYVIPLIYASISTALGWIVAAQFTLDRARDRLTGAGVALGQLPGAAQAGTVYEFFHLDKLSRENALRSLTRIHGIFAKMRTCIGHQSAATEEGSGFFQEDPTPVSVTRNYAAFTFPGGFSRRDPATGLPRMSKGDFAGTNVREDAIYVATDHCRGLDRTGLVRVIIHELAHFVGPEKESPDRILDFKDFGVKDRDFEHCTPAQAVRIAECYAGFAQKAVSNM